MMNQKKYDEIIAKVKAGWPPDRIISLTSTQLPSKNRLILRCANDSIIRFSLMELPKELLNDPDFPAMTRKQLHNKLLIQWTDDLDAKTYRNLGAYIYMNEIPKNEAMKEALEELSFRVQIGEHLR